jgi:uncharacterized membrane protein YkvA (DUF1232 family)
MNWLWIALAVVAVVIVPLAALLIWARISGMTPALATSYMREFGIDLVRLPGRLRRVSADARTPRCARWWLIGLAIYIASPIDPIPDFLPVVGFLDEVVLVPLILRHVRNMIPDEVWHEHFPPAAETSGILPDGTPH